MSPIFGIKRSKSSRRPENFSSHSGTPVKAHWNTPPASRSPTGTYLGQFGTNGAGAGQLSHSFSIATDPVNGNLYVADTGNHRIEAFTSTGTYLNTFGSEGTGTGQFEEPFGVAINNTGEIYATDHTNNRVEQWLP
jgi:DNA-binding beta-propeller fold protein YncE